MLESVGNVPEKALKSITANIMIALEEIHLKMNMSHGAITPSQILFDKQGNAKV